MGLSAIGNLAGSQGQGPLPPLLAGGALSSGVLLGQATRRSPLPVLEEPCEGVAAEEGEGAPAAFTADLEPAASACPFIIVLPVRWQTSHHNRLHTCH
jgi:hypothetical protein